jgi:Rod binding domain-containing protein
MSGSAPVGRLDAPAPRDGRAALRKAAQALEGLFLGQLMQAMRESVPDSGLLEGDPGQDAFQSLLDERLAQLAAERMKGGLSETLVRQLEKKLAPVDGAAASTPAAPAPVTGRARAATTRTSRAATVPAGNAAARGATRDAG